TRLPASNSTTPSNAMCPRSGRTRPAIMLAIVVLPAPDEPNSAVTPPAASNLASSVKSPSRFPTSSANILLSVDARVGKPREQFGCDKRQQREDDSDDHQPQCGGIARWRLRIGIDRGRDRLRLAGDIRHEGDGRAELAERFGEAQHHAGDDAWQCE